MVRVHVPVPEQAPDQLRNALPPVAAAVKETTVPLVYVAAQVPDVTPAATAQLIAAGDDVTLPLPEPAPATASVTADGGA